MRRWSEARGHEVVGTAVDTDVSGDVSPFDRPGLGPWLTDPEKIGTYDGILAAHIDRLGRSTGDFVDLLRWAEKHGKTVITTALGDTVDFSQGVGKLIGFMMMWLAEEELKAIKRRTGATFTWLKDNGYLTGKPPFGYVITDKDNHKTILPDPTMTDADGVHVLQAIARKYSEGQTIAVIARWLHEQGYAPPQGGAAWSHRSIAQLLRNPVLIGRLESNGRTVNGPDGTPLVRCEPVLTPTEWKRLQARLDSNPTSRMPAEAAPLVRVVHCLKCAGSMYRLVSKAKDAKGNAVQYVYYRCKGTEVAPSKCRNMIRESELTDALAFSLMGNYGHLEMMGQELVPGNDVAARLAIVTESLSELEADRYERGLFTGPEGAERFARLYGGLEARLTELRAQEAVEEHYRPIPLGYTVAKRWSQLEPSEHGNLLRSLGIKAYVLAKMPAKGLSGTTPGLGFNLADLNGVAPVGTPVVVLVTPNKDDVKQAITAL